MPHCRRTYCYQVRRTFLQFGAYPKEVRRRSVSVGSQQVRWRELTPDIYAWCTERLSKLAAIASQLKASGEGDGHVSQWREGSAASRLAEGQRRTLRQHARTCSDFARS